MKPYGLPRRESGDTDCAGIKANGRPTRLGHLPGPGGDARASQRPASKAAARRTHKRRARTEGRRSCRQDRE